MSRLKIGTRGSKLALWQANNLKFQLEKLGYPVEIIIIKTKGDQIQDLSFDKLEGKGFFTSEIESELIAGNIDVAVHSLKDLPTEKNSMGLVLAGLSKRENPSDVLIFNSKYADDFDFRKQKITVGTSSIRRKTQLKHLIANVETVDLRGNVPTRIRKLEELGLDAIVLAAAGLNRLEINLEGHKSIILHPKEFIPAPGQGVIAYQCRESDNYIRKIIDQIHNRKVALCTNIERSVLRLMDGGCQTPIGVYCELDEYKHFHLFACYSKESKMLHKTISRSTSNGIVDDIVGYFKKETQDL